MRDFTVIVVTMATLSLQKLTSAQGKKLVYCKFVCVHRVCRLTECVCTFVECLW
jgi:hypothetical protein